MEKLTCILPAFNEEKTISRVLRVLKKVQEIDELLVVDDGSTDQTGAVARTNGARVLRHQKNSGKGAAIKTGASHAKNNLLLFIDADLQSLNAAKVRKLALPLLQNSADFVKASYTNPSGRVTKLVAKPLLKIVHPFLKLEQPLSGEFGFNRKKIDMDKIEDGWGVDIQLVFQAARKNLRIQEVFIGRKVHKHQSVESLSIMSEQVMRTILSELNLISHHKKVVFFDLDETLIQESSITVLAKEWGFTDELKMLQKRVARGEIPDKEITRTLAKHFKGRTREEVSATCARLLHINSFALKVIESLRRQRYRVRIVSAAFSPVVRHFAATLNVYEFFSPRLARDSSGKFSGKLKKSRFEDRDCSCCGRYVCKRQAVKYFQKRFAIKPEECIAVGDGKSDACMFKASGTALGFHTDIAPQRIEQLSEVLMYLD
ncbi:MAG: HAD-IB family phosphatase [Candidatus Peribacteraceae bacterium]|nr:HAD-IB family phosphatase [Candidatus Peribacteraceae bacterium]MBP9850124.1 HAD-IB family phosphatase [Candidatus Peribacteraceae bacterium]